MNEAARGYAATSRRRHDSLRAFMMPEVEATVLAFDFGTRRIGVAMGNTLLRVARPLATLDGSDNPTRFAAIAALVAEWQPQRLVVGIPVHADGSAHEMTLRARRFSRQLAGRFRLPVVEVDERYTTEAAQVQLAGAGEGGRAGRAKRDAVAAQLILQAYFDERPAN